VLEDSLAGIEGGGRHHLDQPAGAEPDFHASFVLSRDADSAAADVRDKVSRVRQRLPQGIDEPVIAKVEADAFPVIWLAFSSDTLDSLATERLWPTALPSPCCRPRRAPRM
jgi:multidrug efflux pump